MLDDLKMIHLRDVQDALGIAERQWQQLVCDLDFKQSPVLAENIIYAGMGGSALAAQMSLSWPGYRLPFQIVRDYDVPTYVSEKTFFIAASYSGNTEETVSAIAQAEARGAQIAVIAGGGKLAQLAQDRGYPLVLLPSVVQSRYGLLYNFRALLLLSEQAGLLATTNVSAELERGARFIQNVTIDWLPTVPTDRNPAKQLALEIIGESAVIYSGPKLAPIAAKWKMNLNENAKHIAWWNQLPEFNHNEFTGWAKQPIIKPYTVIELRSKLEHPQIQKRFVTGERLLSGLRPQPYIVAVQGNDLLEQLLWASTFGDFVTLYVALLNGLNPTPVDLADRFKKSMEESNE
jgi:glucose/mannose-6-phosphate isomerase